MPFMRERRRCVAAIGVRQNRPTTCGAMWGLPSAFSRPSLSPSMGDDKLRPQWHDTLVTRDRCLAAEFRPSVHQAATLID